MRGSDSQTVFFVQYPTIAFDIGFFEWLDRIQTYDDGEFNYFDKLLAFVDRGMGDPTFISTVAKIVAKGSANSEGPIQ